MNLWTPENLALLGTMKDKDLGLILGLSDRAVQTQRSRMGVASFTSQQPTLPPFDRKAYMRAYQAHPDNRERLKAKRDKWRKTDKGKACLAKCRKSPAHQASIKRYQKSDKAKATAQRYREKIKSLTERPAREKPPLDPDQYADWIISQLPTHYL